MPRASAQKRAQRRRRGWRRAGRRARNEVLALGIRMTAEAIGRLPVAAGRAVGRALGYGAYLALRRSRRLALAHLAIAFPELRAAGRRAVAAATFRHAGESFAEVAAWWVRGREALGKRIEIEGEQWVERALAMGRGLVVVTGHLGNWELMAAEVTARGYPLTVLARRVREKPFERLVSAFRSRAGVRTLLREETDSIVPLLRELRANRIVGLLVDQDTRGRGVFVPFFGRPAHTPAGAAVLALRSRAPVVAAFIERTAAGTHTIRVRPLHGFSTERARPSVRELTATFTRAIEEQLRRRPEQWVWWHRRWRRQPAPAARADARCADAGR